MNRFPLLAAAAALAAGVTPPAVAQDEGMGRLFFTPAQRAQLDNARRQNVRAPIPGDQPEEAQPLPQEVTVNGMIRRNDGRTTVWVNNKMVAPEAASGGAVEVRARGDTVTLSLPQSGRSVDLKIGQSVEALSGQIADVYQRRTPLALEGKPAPEAPPQPKPAPDAASARPQNVEKVTATPAPPAGSATKSTEAIERKRKSDDGVPWGMLQSDSK